MTPTETYPALMAYILDRAARVEGKWDQLHTDEREAVNGAFADIAADLERAHADYATQQKAKGHDGYPYNTPVCEFLGLELKANRENTGYYFACCVARHYALGVARREVEALIEAGNPLIIVTARSKTTREPCRFVRFAGPDQIKIEGNTITASNGKRRAKLSSNWSVETCLQKTARAMREGVPF